MLNHKAINFIIENAKLMKVKVSQSQAEKLQQYAELIQKWNKTYNLTAVKNLDDIIKIHILDSLSIINFIKPTNLLDIGAGAGLPSIVLAIMIVDLKVVAVDSIGKKCHFMQFVKTHLQLNNFKVINARVENIKNYCFEQITSRAFTKINNNLKLSQHLLAKNGVFLLMKGANYQQENCNLALKAHKLIVPFISTKRFLLEIKLKNHIALSM